MLAEALATSASVFDLGKPRYSICDYWNASEAIWAALFLMLVVWAALLVLQGKAPALSKIW